MMNKAVYASRLAAACFVAAGCVGDSASRSADEAASTSEVRSTSSGTTTVKPAATSSTDPPADPPATDGDGNVVEPANDVEGASISVSPTMAPIGAEVTITVTCPRDDVSTEAFFWSEDANVQYQNSILLVLPATADPRVFETVTTVPYWVGVGPAAVRGLCLGAAEPQPATLEVLPSSELDAWEPLRHAWIDNGRSQGTPPPAPATEQVQELVAYDMPISVHALCQGGTVAGAKFMIWTSNAGSPDLIDSVEYLVLPDGYDVIDDGVVVSATITLDESDFSEDYEPTRAVTALCADTPGPFVPITEPDRPRLLLLL